MTVSKQNNRKKQVAFAACVLVAIFFLLLIPLITTFNEIESRTWDWRLRMAVRPGEGNSKIRIIEIRQEDLNNREEIDGIVWPWPRSLYIPVIKFLELAGAKGLAFDLLFTEASYLRGDEDRLLGDAVRSSMPVISAVALSDSDRPVDTEKFKIFKERQIEEDKRTGFSNRYDINNKKNRFSSVTLPVKELLKGSAAFGNVTSNPDSDGVFRHYTPLSMINNVPVLGLPFALYNSVNSEKALSINEFKDSDGLLTIRYIDPRSSYRPVSIDQVINSYLSITEGKNPELSPESFKDAWVFLGTSAPGLLDLRPTPLNERGNGVEINAVVLDNLLHGDFAIKASSLSTFVVSLLFIISIVAIVFYIPLGAVQGLLITLLIMLPTTVAVVSSYYGYWLPLVAPTISVVAALLLALAFQFQLEGKQHRFIKNAFRYYVSPSVIDEIVSDPSSLALGGERRELTMFFSDVKGFTSIAEGLEATKLVSLINTFLTEMTNIIQAHSGTVDKYVGDAVVAFWNAPLSVPDHAIKGVQAALECQKRMSELSSNFNNEFGVKIELRIGIHTGIATVGNFGSQERFSYTMIGDSVNLASRLEGANKVFGTSILLSGDTQRVINDLIPTRKIADIRVVGRSEPVAVYEPVFHLEGLSSDNVAIYREALANYESGKLSNALEIFKMLDADVVSKNYIDRLEREIRKGQDAEWSHIWNLTEK